jgi:hypothetical protein
MDIDGELCRLKKHKNIQLINRLVIFWRCSVNSLTYNFHINPDQSLSVSEKSEHRADGPDAKVEVKIEKKTGGVTKFF